MSTNAPNTPPPADPPMPTIAELMAVTETAAKAASEAKSAAEAATIAATTTREEMAKLGHNLPAETVEQISKQMSDHLTADWTARGAFGGDNPPPPPADPATVPPTGDPATPPAVTPPGDPAPKKDTRNAAQKFLNLPIP